ncbi:GL13182 [Drosophila persimilis]|uniref:GL13182 n=1 Tax=Drosophila persimilis TaxID=7234 RepID=B4ISJ4_DROPE|nr:GL13182 [Drosophila persimilis]
MHSSSSAVHEIPKQASGKLEKLVGNWKSLDADAGKMEYWIDLGEQQMANRPALLNTPHID